MPAALRIALKDLKLRVRDKSLFILGIITPLALAFIFNLVFGGADAEQLDLRYGLVDLDHTPISRSLGEILAGIEEEGILTVTEYPSREVAAGAIDAGDIGAFILLEEGLGEAALAARPFTIRVVGDVDSPTTTQIASAIAAQFGSGIGLAQLSVTTALELLDGPPPPDVVAWGEEAATQDPVYVVSDRSAETRQLDATTFFAAGMSVFFLFFTVQFGVNGLLEEEQQGTLARLLAAPMARRNVVVGKAILAFLLGVLSMGVLIGATTLLMGASWGSPLGVALLVITGVLAAMGVMSIVAAVAKSPEGAGNLGAVIAVILGMLGGTFFPLGQGNDLLSRATLVTPHAWFMRGVADLAGGAVWASALPAAGAMALFALVTGMVGWILLDRRVAA